ncbi:MAG: EAL domain-containing protein [Elusimicrobia bacterium]|nr:EAL domain-containing protein [Elusimicrobiota bacterium]
MRRSRAAPEPVQVLVFRLCHPERIKFIHGGRLSAIVRDDLGRGFERIARSVLRRHIPLGRTFSPRFGVWLAPFRMKTTELGFDSDDQKAAIEEAGTALIHSLLETELGRASALHVDFHFGILREDSGETDPIRLHRRLKERIETLHASMVVPAISRRNFRRVLSGRHLDFQLQPIVSLRNLKTVGFEALARGPAGGPVERADRLFAAASYYGLHRELDLACITAALSRASTLPAPFWLSVNLGPDLFDPAVLRRLVPRPEIMRRRVFELTEHLPIGSPEKFAARSKSLRRSGGRVALDDAGCGYLDMGMVETLSPHIVKLCITVIRRIETGPVTLGAIKDVVKRIRAAGAAPLAEGVETEEQLRLVRECGFTLAQGYVFSKPRPASEVLSELRT